MIKLIANNEEKIVKASTVVNSKERVSICIPQENLYCHGHNAEGGEIHSKGQQVGKWMKTETTSIQKKVMWFGRVPPMTRRLGDAVIDVNDGCDPYWLFTIEVVNFGTRHTSHVLE
jgi:hypothetical protein